MGGLPAIEGVTLDLLLEGGGVGSPMFFGGRPTQINFARSFLILRSERGEWLHRDSLHILHGA